MSKNNRQPSPRPATQSVSTRPQSPGEGATDVTRVPSPATVAQAEDDADVSDPERYQAQPGVTETDPAPGEATDLPVDGELQDDDAVDADAETDEAETDEDAAADEGADFAGFDDISERPSRRVKASAGAPPNAQMVQTVAATVIHRSEAAQEAYMAELVPIVPRITQQRVSINGEWYNFVKGMEQYVPRAVEEHLKSKGLI